jgi:hypothetical protein
MGAEALGFRQDDEFTDVMASLPPKPRRRWLIWTGKSIRFVFIVCLATILAYSSLSIGNRPLGSITLNQLLGSLVCLGLAVGCARWMFDSIEDKRAERWAAWAGSIAALLFVAALILFAMLGHGGINSLVSQTHS